MTRLGKYELHEQLGKGGFGTVYRATDTSLGRVVALKILHPQMAADAEFVERFRKEARLAAQLENPHVVTIHDVGEQDGYYYIVMRYYPGGSLADLLKNGPLTWDKCVNILAQVCEGLNLLHQQGWVHRDLKPSNILFDPQGGAVVADFGLARALTTTGSLSSSGGYAGTPHYKAPELWRGKPPASPATDVYALGCILGEMLTGQMLFPGDTPDEVMTKHVLDGPEFGEKWPQAGVPEGAKNFIQRCLSKSSGDRPKDAAGFFRELRVIGAKATTPLKAEASTTQPTISRATRSNDTPPVQNQSHPQPLAVPSVPVQAIPPIHQAQAGRTPYLPQSKKARQAPHSPRLSTWGWMMIIVFGGGLIVVGIILFVLIEENIQGEISYKKWMGTETAAASTVTLATAAPEHPTESPAAEEQPTKAPVAAGCTQAGQTQVSSVDGMIQVCVPSGEFFMGSDKSVDSQSTSDELPKHSEYLDAFWIDQTEVTNAMFTNFLQATGIVTSAEYSGWAYIYKQSEGYVQVEGASWRSPLGTGSTLEGKENFPVILVSWDDAQAYCEWAGRRLPNEAEWEKAARGTDGRIYPWGNTPPDGNLINFADSNTSFDWSNKSVNDGYAETSPVGAYPNGVSPYGALDMAGNVWEWIAQPASNPQGSPESDVWWVKCGGSWFLEPKTLTRRVWVGIPSDYDNNTGFRCAR